MSTTTELPPLEPLPQDDGPFPVVSIAYTESAAHAFGMLRAVIAAKETSERALEITADAITENAANYGAWYWRRRCLDALGTPVNDELNYLAEVVEDNPKNYQIWHHRRMLIQKTRNPSEEKAFTEMVLADDSKNYHAWSHRQWAVKEFSLWEGELEFTERLISEDVRNNSAWNHRWLAVTALSGWSEPVIAREINYAFDCILLAPENPSPWNYLRGIVRKMSAASVTAAIVPKLAEITGLTAAAPSVEPLSFQAFVAHITGDKTTEAEMYSKLVEVDPIREKYWASLMRKAVGTAMKIDETD